MMHKGRVFQIAEVKTTEDLADKLTQHTWTGCTGFRLGSLLFLNDSTSADGAQEYAAVISEDGEQAVQVESITFSWCSLEEAVQHIKTCMEYAKGTAAPPVRIPIKILTDHGARCHLCA